MIQADRLHSRLQQTEFQLEAAQVRIRELEMLLHRKEQAAPLPIEDDSFKYILDNLMEGAQIVGYDWRYLYINDSGARQARHSKEDLINASYFERFPGFENTPMYAQLNISMVERLARRFEQEYIFADGEIVYFEINVLPVPQGIFILSIDITERKASEHAQYEQYVIAEALRNSLEMLTTTLDVETVMSYILSFSATVIPSEAATIIRFDGNTGRIVQARGYTPEVEAFLKTVEMPLDSGKLQRLFGENGYYLIEDTRTAPEWTPILHTDWIRSSIAVPMVIRGERIGMLVVDSATPNQFKLKDVKNLQAFARYAGLALENAQHVDQLESRVIERTAELQAANARLEEQQRQLRYHARLQENVSDAVLVTDLNFHIQSWNHAAERIYGFSAAEALGQTTSELMRTIYAYPSERDHIIKTLYEKGWWRGEVIQLHQDGTALHILASITLLKDETGIPYSVVSVNHDISDQKRAENELRQALDKEKELGELKTRFVSMASHEFRTPLAAILALTETLTVYRHQLPDDQVNDRLSKIMEHVDHLRIIMDDVLALARFQANRVDFKPVLLNLDALCRSVIEDFETSVGFDHNLHYQCLGESRAVRVDRKLMLQIISNLISNAIKYSSTGTCINITLNFASDTLMLSVRDEGIGIPESDLRHLFQPFHRAGNVGMISGTGLGLVITRESVERHGGTISVESKVDVGSTFTVRIPLGETNSDF